jgi:muramidase (phage lysozyme)
MGRPALKGKRRPKLSAVLVEPKTVWTSVMLTEWYGGQTRKLEYVSSTAVWYHNGMPPAAIRWVLVRDPSGQRDAQAFLCTELDLEPTRSSSASCAAGGLKQPFRRSVNIWASRRNGNGRTWRSCAPHRRCWDSTHW